MASTTLPPATDLTGASQTQGQVKTALTNLVAWCNERQSQGADIVSATTTDIGAASGDYVRVTGTTTITALGTIQAGVKRIVEFTGVLTLTHNATSLILPTGANITTAAGDTAVFVSKGSGYWKCTGYQRANGSELNSSSVDTYYDMITNGQFLIDQYNAAASHTLTASSTYNIDRWISGASGGSPTAQRVSTGNSAFPFAYRITGASGTTFAWVGQRIASADTTALTGGAVTVAFVAANSLLTSLTVSLKYANAANNFSTTTSIGSTPVTINSTLTRYTVTFTGLPAGTANGLYFEFVVGAQTSGTWDLGYVQMVRGTSTPALDFRPYDQEVNRCLFRNCKTFPLSVKPIQNSGDVANVITSNLSSGASSYTSLRWTFPVPMASTPTITTYNPSAANANFRKAVDSADSTATVVKTSIYGCTIHSANNVNASDYGMIHAVAHAELY